MKFNYYEPPTQQIFNAIKNSAIELWLTYDDTYGYATEKIQRIENIKNVADNAWYIVGMFDHNNQRKLIEMLPEPAKAAVQHYLRQNLLDSLRYEN